MPNLVYIAPFRSVAAALLLVVFFGPVGLFYSSLIGGIVMCIFALAGFGVVAAMGSILPMATIWLFSVLWAMVTVRLYNNRLLRKLTASNNCCEPLSMKCDKTEKESKPGKPKKNEKAEKKEKTDHKAETGFEPEFKQEKFQQEQPATVIVDPKSEDADNQKPHWKL